jgi:hypothetical protein
LENVDIFYGHLEHFTDIWDILLPFCTFCVHFVHFVFIWYISCEFGTFCVHLVHFARFGIYVAPRKIWQTWSADVNVLQQNV